MMISNLKTFAIKTLGCKVNSYESNLVKNELIAYGLNEVEFDCLADIYIINTCSVTNTADSKSKNMISRARKTNPNAILVVMGCYSQVAKKEIQEELDVQIWIGNKFKNNIINLIQKYLKNKQNIYAVNNLLLEKEFEKSSISVYKGKTRAFLKIQDGCNFMCSYCIIPFSRGRQRSKNALDIINEIKTLVSNGYKEIVLTGVNVAGYFDQEKNINFYKLLCLINEISGDFRIRISSVEPFQINDDIINLIVNNHRFCQHWHICLQSGSDQVLNKMNRKYSTKEFLLLINKIKSKNPKTSFCTDYITGFPTETEQDHKDSINLLKKINFYDIHLFPYSKRKFTPAANLSQINGKVKKQRMNEILKIQKELQYNYLKQFIGQKVEVLFEKEYNGFYIGHSGEYFLVHVKKELFENQNPINKIYNIRIIKIILNNAIGELLK